MTRDELLAILRAHKISPTRTQYRQNGKAVECVSGCKLAVPYGRSVVVAIEEHQADILEATLIAYRHASEAVAEGLEEGFIV